MLTLLHLKHAVNETAEGVASRWADMPRLQFFSGCAYHEDRQPCDATTLVKLRQLLGDEGMDELLAQTINVAVDLKLIKPQELASRKAGRYAHAHRFKRMKSAIKRPSTIVCRQQRAMERKASAIGAAVPEALNDTLNKAKRIWGQSTGSKAVDGRRKLYAWRAPEVICISKGKARTPYDFGVKAGIVSRLKGNLIVGAKSFHGNPYDGHTLHKQLEQATILVQDGAVKPTKAFADLGYWGVDADNPDVNIVHRGRSRRISEQERKPLKRRQASESIIGYLKSDNRMDRCHLKGETGDRLHVVLCAAGDNIRWLLRMIARKGITLLAVIFLCLLQAGVQGGSWLASVTARLIWVTEGPSLARHSPRMHRLSAVDALPCARNEYFRAHDIPRRKLPP